MNVIALVPARSGSKGIINKNLTEINGKSLIQRAIEYAVNSSWIDSVYISTDSNEYQAHAISIGAKSLGLRSAELSTDLSKSLDVCKDFIKNYQETIGRIDKLVLLQPTSPIRPLLSENEIHRLFSIEGCKTLTTISRVEEPHPYKMLTKKNNGDIFPLFHYDYLSSPRQSLPLCFQLTGSVYIWDCVALLRSDHNYPEPVQYVEQDKFVNIDTAQDLEKAKALLL